MAALLVAVLAAVLAVTEQGAKHAEIRVQENSIFATDAWAQYQAKSTRGTMSAEFAGMIGVLGAGDTDLMDRRRQLLDQLKLAQERFENDPTDGKRAHRQAGTRLRDATRSWPWSKPMHTTTARRPWNSALCLRPPLRSSGRSL